MKRGSLVLVVGGLALVVAMAFLPRTKAENQGSSTQGGADARVEEAIRMVQTGENPMEGVMLLREILEEDPNNLQATYALGMLSVQSGQFDKAVDRFTRVLEIDPKQNEAYRLRAEAHEALGNKELAIQDYQVYLDKTDDVKAQETVQLRINELTE